MSKRGPRLQAGGPVEPTAGQTRDGWGEPALGEPPRREAAIGSGRTRVVAHGVTDGDPILGEPALFAEPLRFTMLRVRAPRGHRLVRLELNDGDVLAIG